MSLPSAARLPVAENAVIARRLNSITRHLGPRLSRRHHGAVDHAFLADGLRLEAAIHASISGSLAISGVGPLSNAPDDSLWQAFANNSTDGGYDLVDACWHRIGGTPEPGPSAVPEHAHAIAAFMATAGLPDDMWAPWWLQDGLSPTHRKVWETGLAAHLFLTTERFEQAPPVQQIGRNGTNDNLRAPDVVNSIEHLEAQLFNLRAVLAAQRSRLLSLITMQEDILVAAYDLMYENAPNSDAALARRYITRDGELPGGRKHINDWMEDWSSHRGTHVDTPP